MMLAAYTSQGEKVEYKFTVYSFCDILININELDIQILMREVF